MRRRKFFVLENTRPASEISSMLGRVVDDKYDPTVNCAPKKPLAPSSILPGLIPKPSESVNRTELLQVQRGTGVRARLADLFHIDVGQRTETQLRFQSELVRRYEVNSPRDTFADLMKDERYANEVRAFLRASTHGDGYMITGLMTTTNTTWGASDTRNSDVSIGVDVPLEALTGLPLPSTGFDISVLSKEVRREGEAFVVAEEIFAVSYIVVKLEKRGVVGRRGAPAAGGTLWASDRDCALSTSLTEEGPEPASYADNVSEEISVGEVVFDEDADYVIVVESVLD